MVTFAINAWYNSSKVFLFHSAAHSEFATGSRAPLEVLLVVNVSPGQQDVVSSAEMISEELQNAEIDQYTFA
jgi:hypothetical protein